MAHPAEPYEITQGWLLAGSELHESSRPDPVDTWSRIEAGLGIVVIGILAWMVLYGPLS